MILKKLASAIRRQDWFQVVIEVLIVIVGIFLGLQVQEWNEARQNKSDGNEYLSRLYQDLEYDTLHFSDNRSGVETKILMLNTVEELIKSGDVNWRTKHALNFSSGTGGEIDIDLFRALEYSTVFGWSFPKVRTTTFLDLQNSGNLALIDDSDLRYEMSYYFEESLNAHSRTLARLTGYPQKVYQLVYGGARTTFAHILEDDLTIYDRPEFLPQISKKDFIDRARLDDEFLKLLRAEKNYATFLIVMIDQQLKGTEILKKKVAAYLKENK